MGLFMTSRLHQYGYWNGAAGVYMVVGIYCHPYSKQTFLTLVGTQQDEETGVLCPEEDYPVIIALEDEMTFIGEDNEIHNK
jgi:hypothetical protein